MSLYTLGLLKYVSKCVRLIARLDIFLSIQFELLFSHLEFVKLVKNVILSSGLIEITKLFVEKTRWEKCNISKYTFNPGKI